MRIYLPMYTSATAALLTFRANRATLKKYQLSMLSTTRLLNNRIMLVPLMFVPYSHGAYGIANCGPDVDCSPFELDVTALGWMRGNKRLATPHSIMS